MSASGCMGSAEELEPGSSEELDSVQQPLGSYALQKTGEWKKNESSAIDLAAVNDYVCTLTQVSGIFRGGGEEVYVTANYLRSPATWELRGQTKQNSASATATCYRRDAFIGVPGSGTLISMEFSAKDANGHCPPWPIACGDDGQPEPTFQDMWKGDAVAMLTGMAGDFRGNGELVEVQQGLSTSTVNRVAAQSDVDDDHTRARAHAFALASPDGQKRAPRFIGPGGVKGTASVGEFEAGGAGNRFQQLARTDEAFCYLTHIGGGFSTSQTSVKVDDFADGYWWMDVYKGGSSDTKARARCVLLDQR